MPQGRLFIGALVIALAGCGEVRITYGDAHCWGDPPGIVVEFISMIDGSAIAVAATGELRDGPYVESMSPGEARYAGPGRTYDLTGGYGREGIYDVLVETGRGETLTWTRIKVSADRCGPFTIVLQAPVSPF